MGYLRKSNGKPTNGWACYTKMYLDRSKTIRYNLIKCKLKATTTGCLGIKYESFIRYQFCKNKYCTVFSGRVSYNEGPHIFNLYFIQLKFFFQILNHDVITHIISPSFTGEDRSRDLSFTIKPLHCIVGKLMW